VTTTTTTGRAARWGRWVPLALVALVAVPAVAGSLRLAELAGAPPTLPAKPHVTASPVWLVAHIVAAVLFAVVGAFQFSPGLRRRRRRWHRVAGRVVVAAGLTVAATALVMTFLTPHTSAGGVLLFVFRLAAGTGMAASLVLGVATVRRGDVCGHRAWMLRAYALGLGAGTQVFTIGIGEVVFGSSELTNALMQGAAWAINLTVAERAIRRYPRPAPTPRLVAGVGSR
jgi:uncharacterized membrane protein